MHSINLPIMFRWAYTKMDSTRHLRTNLGTTSWLGKETDLTATKMNIRQATVSTPVSTLTIPQPQAEPAHHRPTPEYQVNDLLGMQKTNLFNLPENYTFKYCQSPLDTRSLFLSYVRSEQS